MFLLMVQLTLGTWGPQAISHANSGNDLKKQILEITDSGSSELSLSSSDYAITTMSMKNSSRFAKSWTGNTMRSTSAPGSTARIR